VLGFSRNDTLGLILVCAYIAAVFFISEKAWKGDRAVGRKMLHISIGNIVFMLFLFDHWWVEVLIAGSALVFSLLTARRMQDYLKGLASSLNGGGSIKKACSAAIKWLTSVSASGAGNEFGLVYYCLMFTLLAFLFFKTPVVVAVGMLALAYGDGLGAVVGMKYGRHPYRLFDKKSVEGSLAVFVGAALAIFAGMAFYGVPLQDALWMSAAIGLVVSIVEGIAFSGLDNVAIPLSAVALFISFGVL
jgi:phytol kinase